MKKTQLMLNDEIQLFFENDDKHIWNLILENKIEDLLAILPREKDSIQDKILKELLSEGKSGILESYDFVKIREDNSDLARSLVRLIIALDINGNHEGAREEVAEKLLDTMPDVVKVIQENSQAYPKNSINALVWAEGAGMRAALNGLALYFRLKGDVDHQHFATMLRTQITLAIMGHYKNFVGPDMIDSARVKELIGQKDAAIAFYNAVKTDFMTDLSWFRESPEVGPHEEDRITLDSLKEALSSLDRLNNTDENEAVCAEIDEVLSRECFEVPDFDEEDEEDDE